MRISRFGIAALLLATSFATAAFAQGTTGATVTPAKPATPAAKPAAPPAKAEAAKPAAESKPVPTKPGGVARTLVGEIVDPACYLVNGAHGDGHKECATACAKAGQTLAILERKTNKLYLLVTDHPGDDPNKSVLDYIAQTVTIKGKVYARGGVTGLMVLSIQPGAAKAE